MLTEHSERTEKRERGNRRKEGGEKKKRHRVIPKFASGRGSRLPKMLHITKDR